MSRLIQICAACFIVAFTIPTACALTLVDYNFEGLPLNPGGAGTPPTAPPSTVDPLVSASDMSIGVGAGGLTILNMATRDGVVSGQRYSFQQAIPNNSNVPPSDYHTFDFSVTAGPIPVEIVSMSLISGHNNVDNPTTHQSIVEFRNAANTLIGSAPFSTTFGLAGGPSGVLPVNLSLAANSVLNVSIRLDQQVIGPNSSTTQFRVDNVKLEGAAVPEPSTFALTALGLLGLAFCGWRRKRNLAD